jgi:hypothetical protein
MSQGGKNKNDNTILIDYKTQTYKKVKDEM